MQSGTERRILIFEMHDLLYAFDLAHVSEVSEPLPSWPIPLAPPCCIGAMHIHGSIIAAVDLAACMGLPQCRNPEKMIVLSKDIAAMSLLVERIVRIEANPGVEIHASPDNDFICSVLVLPEGRIMLLDAINIVRAVEDLMSSPHYS